MHLIWKTCILMIMAAVVATESEKCSNDICSRVRCKSLSKDDCKENETYEPKGGSCGCCPACVPQQEQQCEPDTCDRVDCARVTEEDCKEGEMYDPKGSYCGCCPACVPQKEQCRPDTCSLVLCEAVYKKDCKKNQIYDPKGGYCGCCPACITQLKRGQKCKQPVKGGSPPTKRCKKGLVCDPETNRCKPPCGDPDSSDESY